MGVSLKEVKKRRLNVKNLIKQKKKIGTFDIQIKSIKSKDILIELSPLYNQNA